MKFKKLLRAAFFKVEVDLVTFAKELYNPHQFNVTLI